MKKPFLMTLILIFFALGTIVLQYLKYFDGRLHIIFCDVGQGDAVFIRTPKGKNILIDAGPSDKVLSCLSSYMPFWERKISLSILTHPHNDHFAGFNEILNRYKVDTFGMENLGNKTAGYRKLIQTIKKHKLDLKYLVQGDFFKTSDGLRLYVLAPSADFLLRTSPNKVIGETNEFSSLIIHLSYGSFDLILTGDSQVNELKDALRNYNGSSLEILQVPHHGSKSGINEEILMEINPEVAVISVGRNNRYGHPTSYVLDALKSMRIPVFRTDKQKDIEIVADQDNWIIR